MPSPLAGWWHFFPELLFDCGTNIKANWASLGEIARKCSFGFLPTIIYTILDACLNFLVLILPILRVFRLEWPLSKRLQVLGCFMLGRLATAAAFVRMVVFIETDIPSAELAHQTILGLPSYDVLGIVSAEIFWTIIESTVAIIAVCLPAIKKVVSIATFSDWVGLSTLRRYYNSSCQTTMQGSASYYPELSNNEKFINIDSAGSTPRIPDGFLQIFL